MFNPTKGPARELVGAREQIDQRELEQLQKSGALIIDERHRRPLYFDGRFLAARDLTREQIYFLTRQADFGRAGGGGVVHGLMVTEGPGASTILITPGHGITPSGESVVLPGNVPLSIPLTNIAETQRLDAAFGLLSIPRDSPRNRSGLFVLALRPVEFSANPIASYPTAVTGARTVEDGDIVEGVAVTLVPFLEEGPRNELDQPRSRIARQIFLEKSQRGIPASALALALISLERGSVQWIDPFLVRREIGSRQSDVLGLGLSPRGLREAHLLQYHQHFHEIIRQRTARGQGLRFPASEHFLALPSAGQLPTQTINPIDFTQSYFPAEVDVLLSIIPEDEVGALVEDSLELPPIDLTLSADAQESTAVHVLIPLSRAQVRTFASRLANITRPVKAAAPGLLSRRKPLEVLQGLRLPRVTAPVFQPQDVADAAWREALALKPLLWYIRSRNIHVRTEILGTRVSLVRNEVDTERGVTDRIEELGATTEFNRIRNRATSAANAEMVALLSSPRITRSPVLATIALRELDTAESLDRTTVLKVGEKFADPQFGEGVARIERANPEITTNKTVVRNLAASRSLADLDRIARTTPEREMEGLAEEVLAAAKTRSNRLEALVKKRSQPNS
jgi:hypothetical protein